MAIYLTAGVWRTPEPGSDHRTLLAVARNVKLFLLLFLKLPAPFAQRR